MIINILRYIKGAVKVIFHKFGIDISNFRKFPANYFYNTREIITHPALKEVRETIYQDCPSPMYRESYHVHQIGAWGPIPALVFQIIQQKQMISKGILNSLDIGCAFGTMAAFCSSLGCQAAAVDFVPIETHLGVKTKEKYNIQYQQVSIETEPLPFSPQTFDLITMTEVLEHFLYQPVDTLKKTVTALKDDGVILLTTPALGKHWKSEFYNCKFTQIPAYKAGMPLPSDRHWKIYDPSELTELLSTVGLNSLVGLFLNINTGLEGMYAVAFKKRHS